MMAILEADIEFAGDVGRHAKSAGDAVGRPCPSPQRNVRNGTLGEPVGRYTTAKTAADHDVVVISDGVSSGSMRSIATDQTNQTA